MKALDGAASLSVPLPLGPLGPFLCLPSRSDSPFPSPGVRMRPLWVGLAAAVAALLAALLAHQWSRPAAGVAVAKAPSLLQFARCAQVAATRRVATGEADVPRGHALCCAGEREARRRRRSIRRHRRPSAMHGGLPTAPEPLQPRGALQPHWPACGSPRALPPSAAAAASRGGGATAAWLAASLAQRA